jgi:putative PIN family toxin of toxin-antitoxin system
MRQNMLIVLDTNVLVSTLLFSGRASHLHAMWVADQVRLVFSDAVLAEYRRVLAYPKFGLTGGEVQALMEEEVLPFGTVVPETQHGKWITDDPTDDKFIELVLSAKADHLVSGDAHILNVRQQVPCSILTIQEFLAKA